jgi:murein DD-endopeptidase MepM/ murein hydrolase activator NlpD
MKSFARSFGLVVAFLVLAACTATKPPPYQPIDGSAIIPGEEVTVVRGENVYTIARKNNVRMREIIALNNLQPPFTIKAGQRLVLPARKGSDSGGDYAPVPSSAPPGRIEAMPLSSSAVTSEPLAPPPSARNYNATASDGSVSAGEPLPAKTPFGVGPSVPEPVPAETTPAGEAASTAAPTAVTAPAAEASALPMGQFAWPVQGTVISNFGPNQGTNNDGINIAAPKGAPVIAAAGGIVAYTGNEMKGFGNLILIRHEGGWVTAYAHLERMTVAKDGVVGPGDMIGTVGTTGGIATPQLHFEARKDGTPVDPLTVLKK